MKVVRYVDFIAPYTSPALMADTRHTCAARRGS